MLERARLLAPILALGMLGLVGACGGPEADAPKGAPERQAAGEPAAPQAAPQTSGSQRAASGDGPLVNAADQTAEALGDAADTVEEKGVGGATAEAADAVEDEVEHSVDVGEHAYEVKREKGEAPLSAAGAAYNAVLDIPDQEHARPDAQAR